MNVKVNVKGNEKGNETGKGSILFSRLSQDK